MKVVVRLPFNGARRLVVGPEHIFCFGECQCRFRFVNYDSH